MPLSIPVRVRTLVSPDDFPGTVRAGRHPGLFELRRTEDDPACVRVVSIVLLIPSQNNAVSRSNHLCIETVGLRAPQAAVRPFDSRGRTRSNGVLLKTKPRGQVITS